MRPNSAITASRQIDETLSPEAFAKVSEIARREAGIVLSASKIPMVKARLTRRLRTLRMGSYDAYLAHVESDAGVDEMRHLISALTTNVSHFFREGHHFDLFSAQIIPQLNAQIARGERVRIWSAGCSNGQEPYSIAMTLLAACPEARAKDLRILATDIDPDVVATAAKGRYSGHLATGLDADHLARFFEPCAVGDETAYQVRPEVRELVTFRELNLHRPWPMTGQFDVIFCRNVLIYFDEEAQDRLFERFAQILRPGGWLLLGHSERLNDRAAQLFSAQGITAYVKRGSSQPTPRTADTQIRSA